MALIKCPDCGRDISDKAQSCPACGYPMQLNSNAIYFGEYPSGTPIEWNILRQFDDGVFCLISSKCIEAMAYDYNTEDSVDWENCYLRRWLNTTFLESAFSREEKSRMYTYHPSKNVTDGVTILSNPEAEELIPSKENRVAVLTDYAATKNTYGLDAKDGPCTWWLRGNSLTSQMVLATGQIMNWFGGNRNNRTLGVRPVIFAKI